MSFTPILPFSGTVGWKFLQRTQDQQQQVFEKSPVLQRNADAFRAGIASIGSAEELVANRQMLEVALGAFGLAEDINNRALIEKVLTSDTSDSKSLASRFSDKRYLALAQAFGFGDEGGARTGEDGFAERIIAPYLDRSFEVAVGEENETMRLALGLERELQSITEQTKLSENGQWYAVMASPPLRAVFETALGLPDSIGGLDVDQQLGIFKDRAQRLFGTSKVTDFAESESMEELRNKFLLRSDLEAGAGAMGSPGSIALSLLTYGQG